MQTSIEKWWGDFIYDFRTGSVLIVGKCEDDELYSIYNFLKDMFKDEYKNILEQESELEKEEKKKLGRKRQKGKISVFYLNLIKVFKKDSFLYKIYKCLRVIRLPSEKVLKHVAKLSIERISLL